MGVWFGSITQQFPATYANRAKCSAACCSSPAPVPSLSEGDFKSITKCLLNTAIKGGRGTTDLMAILCLKQRLFLFSCVGERKRKPVCTRESDQLTVSDQRCDRIPQPDPITEPCGTECELRCTLLTHVYTLHHIFIVYSSLLSPLALILFLSSLS